MFSTGIDGSLARSNGHVGGVRDQHSAFHDGRCFAAHFHGELGEIAQHFGHLISTLAAAHVDDHIGVGKFGERLGNDGLPTAEGS